LGKEAPNGYKLVRIKLKAGLVFREHAPCGLFRCYTRMGRAP
jgi:hypothetical protein